MAGGEFQEFGFLLSAGFVSDGAAGVEGAAWRGIDRAGDVAGESDLLLLRLRVEHGDGRQEGLGVGVQRLLLELVCGGQFDDAP